MTRGSEGFTLVEVLVALFLIAIGVLAAAPMFMYAIQGNAVGADLGSAGAHAVRRMETLRFTPFSSLDEGGSLTTSLPGYSDDSHPGFEVRWEISSGSGPAGSKTIAVRAVALGPTTGQQKQVTLTTLRVR